MLAVSADPTVSGARASRWFAAAVGIASALLAYALTGPLAIGGHDEGVYLATARALAESGEYRLINLPSAPLQTKYPPAYAALLALTKRALHLDARQVRPLKAINAACLIAIVFLTSELARTLSGGSLGASVVAALLTSTSLALVSQVDVIGSDPLFVALLLGALVMMERRSPIQTMIAGCFAGRGDAHEDGGVGGHSWHAELRGNATESSTSVAVRTSTDDLRGVAPVVGRISRACRPHRRLLRSLLAVNVAQRSQ